MELAKEDVNVLINGRNYEEADQIINKIKLNFPNTAPQKCYCRFVDMGKEKLYLKNTPILIFIYYYTRAKLDEVYFNIFSSCTVVSIVANSSFKVARETL